MGIGRGKVMATGQGNFRKTYYSSLGVKAVEVQPTLEAALKGEELMAEKLQRLCLWVRIPSLYRPLVWRVLLGALPTLKEAWPGVEAEQNAEWKQLESWLDVSDLSQPKKEMTPSKLLRGVLLSLVSPQQLHQLVRFSSSSSRNMSLDHQSPILSSSLLSLSAACLAIGSSSFESFVLLRGILVKLDVPIWNQDEKKRKTQTHKGIERMMELVKEHDPGVARKMEALDVDLIKSCGMYVICDDFTKRYDAGYLISLPYKRWFEAYFSNVLPPETLEGVWDILIAGETAILAYLGLSALLAVKRRILALKSQSDFEVLVQEIPRLIDPDGVANTAVNLWERPILDQMNNEEL